MGKCVSANYVNGDKYIGSLRNNTFDGMGKFISSKGDIYIGNYKYGKMHG